MARRPKIKDAGWPSWRYGPYGEAQIFNSPDEVPEGWAKKPQEAFVPPEPEILDRDHMIKQLIDRGVIPNGSWSTTYMKRLLDQ